MKLNKLKQLRDFPAKLTRFVKRGFKRTLLPDGFLKQISGVIHVGANDGAERELYADHNLNVVWIEPIPEVFAQLKTNLNEFPQQQACQYLVTDQDEQEYEFHIANNNGQSSSILDFDLHKDIWAEIHYEKSILLKSIRLKTLIETEGIEMDKYDALIMDTQGTELLVLKGAESLLSGFQYIKTEAADFEVYKNCCQVKDLEVFLGKYGFKELIRTKFASREDGGNCYDIVYKKSNWRQIKNKFKRKS